MTCQSPDLAEVLADRDGVIDVATVLRYLSRGAVRWQLASGRWRSPCSGAIVAQSGPLTERQRLRLALIWAGPGSALGGLTAARLDGFRGIGKRDEVEESIHLVVPTGSWVRRARPELPVVVAANQRLRRRALIRETLGDIAGGAQALSELDFSRLVVRAHRLPEPERQVRRKDSSGRNRYLDVVWEREKLVVEIDGAQHADPLHGWDDMSRDNDLVIDGYRVLRFPAWLVRYHPEHVAARIRAVLATVPKIV